jgi:hypothetical protein
VAYTIDEALEIDPQRQLHPPDGQPLAILDRGKPIREWYA